jgi:excisionase family DNA binding protein
VNAPAREPHRLLSIDEAATYLNVPARWIADAARQRRRRSTRIGKHVRFRIEHLEELIAAGESRSPRSSLRFSGTVGGRSCDQQEMDHGGRPVR